MARAKSGSGMPLFSERLASMERTVRGLVERVDDLEDTVRPDVLQGMLDTCLDLVTKSKADMDAVIHKNGQHVLNRVRQIEAKCDEVKTVSEDALSRMRPKLENIEHAVSQFDDLENRMISSFSKGLSDVDRAYKELQRQCSQVDDICEELQKMQSEVDKLVLGVQMLETNLARCTAFVNKNETKLATMETGRMQNDRRSDMVARRVQGCMEKVQSVAGDLSMLAYNVASAGVPHDGQVAGGSDMASAVMAAKLMRKRAGSCPPVSFQATVASPVPCPHQQASR